MTAAGLATTYLPKHAMDALLALGTLKCMFATDTFVPNQDTLIFADDITNEAAGTSYPAGGIPLTGGVINLDTATNTATLDADDITTAGLSVSCRWGAILIDTGTPSTSPVLGYYDFNGGAGNTTVTGVVWDTDGIIPLVVT